MLRVYDEYLQEMATFYGYPENAKEVVFCKYLRFFLVISVEEILSSIRRNN